MRPVRATGSNLYRLKKYQNRGLRKEIPVIGIPLHLIKNRTKITIEQKSGPADRDIPPPGRNTPMAAELRMRFSPPEDMHVIEDPRTGLQGVIAIGSTILGPAAGGCRFWRYPSQAELAADAARLAHGMSYKNALAGLPLGGGKAVLQLPDHPFDRKALFRSFGEAIERLGGTYISAEDVGTSVTDMQCVRECTSYVAGLTARPGMAGGDPSPWTALGVFLSMQEAARSVLGCDLSELTVAIQGLGSVGRRLARLLGDAGARLVVADSAPARAQEVADELGAAMVAPEDIAGVDADIFAPCALGGAINEHSVGQLKARIVCGAANNQLASVKDGDALVQRGIAYMPDYLVNAGGIINVSAEYLGETSQQVEGRVAAIPQRLKEVLAFAAETGRPTHVVADELAEEILSGAKVA